MTTGEIIKKLRTEKGLSQEELGAMVGVQRAAINKYEKGIVVNLRRPVIHKLADALGVAPTVIMGFDEAENSSDEKKPTADDGFSEKKKALIEFAQSVPEDKAELILKVIRSIVEAD